MTSYYRRLRDMREDHDLTQDYRYETGLRDVPTDVLIRLARLYSTSTDYLLGLTQNPEPYK